MSSNPLQSVIVLIPAYMEGERIAATVRAARALPGVSRVLVVDDGSADETAERAAAAGAEVIRHPVNCGKGAALRAGLAACPGDADDIFLLLDADLGETAAEAGKLLTPVVNGEADLAIARFPKATGKAGFGLVKGLARTGTWLLTRRWLAAPISGQRACRRWVLEAAPIANGYGVEVAMNVAAGDVGARIIETPVVMTHAATGRTVSGFKHRGRQYTHIFGALLAAAGGSTGEALVDHPHPPRACAWAIALLLVGVATMLCLGSWLSGWGGRLGGEALVPLAWLAVLSGPLVAAFGSGLLRARRKNFRGRVIPVLGGLLILPVSLFIMLASLELHDLSGQPVASQDALISLPLFLLGWMFLGLLDDVAGTADRKGFTGHIKALLTGNVTTGGIKLLGGGALALLMAWYHTGPAAPRWLTAPLAALLIALSANTLNLFDLRPGRALKVFWLVMGALALVAFHTIPVYYIHAPLNLQLLIAMLLSATLVYAPLDFSGKMMLGDTGSNPLGAFMGLCLAVALPWYGQAVSVAMLIGLHLYAERASITRLIERTPWLRWLDHLGRSV